MRTPINRAITSAHLLSNTAWMLMTALTLRTQCSIIRIEIESFCHYSTRPAWASATKKENDFPRQLVAVCSANGEKKLHYINESSRSRALRGSCEFVWRLRARSIRTNILLAFANPSRLEFIVFEDVRALAATSPHVPKQKKNHQQQQKITFLQHGRRLLNLHCMCIAAVILSHTKIVQFIRSNWSRV